MSITESPKAERLFVDRTRVLASLIRSVHRPQGKIKYLYGTTGVGKTLLLRHFRSKFSKRFSSVNWSDLEQEQDSSIVEAVVASTSARSLDSAFLDFKGVSATGLSQCNELIGLAQLRRQLGDINGFIFPTFDFA